MWLPANSLTTVVCIGAPRRRVDNTPRRVLGDLLDDVLQGLRDAREAAAIYGAQASGPGRPRRFPTFAAFVLAQIAHATDPSHDRELLRLLVATTRRRGGTSQARSAMTARINHLLDETGQDRATRLRDLLADLAEPAGGNA